MGAGGRPERLDKARRATRATSRCSSRAAAEGRESVPALSSPQILVGDLEAFRVGLGLRSDSVAGAGDGQPGIVLGLARADVRFQSRDAHHSRGREDEVLPVAYAEGDARVFSFFSFFWASFSLLFVESAFFY